MTVGNIRRSIEYLTDRRGTVRTTIVKVWLFASMRSRGAKIVETPERKSELGETFESVGAPGGI